MAKFYVGQRVRILWSVEWPELARKEGTIVRRRLGIAENTRDPVEWIVSPDIWGSEFSPDGSSFFHASSNQLATAYDGNEKVSWSECLWQPTPERVA